MKNKSSNYLEVLDELIENNQSEGDLRTQVKRIHLCVIASEKCMKELLPLIEMD